MSLKTFPENVAAQIHQGFALVQASDKYSCPSLFEKILFGSNYRKEWSTVVRMPVFNIKKTNFRIGDMGGGQQTTSLELIDSGNREWVLRSVDKNVKPKDKFTSNRILRAIIQDHVSASYPYAGLSVPDIANAAGVPAGEEYLYFIPDDTAFREHRHVMANKVFILVNKQPQKDTMMETVEMLAKLKADKQCYVEPKAYLKARLVDWLVADWDRHVNQWKWIERKTDSGIAFYVVPKDRDQAFFRSNGLLTKFVSFFFMPQFDKFNKSAKNIKGLSKKALALDKQFLASLKKEDWELTIKEFQKNVSDSVIESAIKKQPPEIFAIRGNELIKKLKSRREGLLKHVMEYYSFLSRS